MRGRRRLDGSRHGRRYSGHGRLRDGCGRRFGRRWRNRSAGQIGRCGCRGLRRRPLRAALGVQTLLLLFTFARLALDLLPSPAGLPGLAVALGGCLGLLFLLCFLATAGSNQGTDLPAPRLRLVDWRH